MFTQEHLNYNTITLFLHWMVFNNLSDFEKIKIDIPKDRFESSLKKWAKYCNTRPYMKKTKHYTKSNLHLEIREDLCETKVFKKDLGIVSPCTQNKILIHAEDQRKISHHLFPCTREFHDVYYSSKLIFKLHSRIKVIFEHQFYTTNENLYFIYITYNHEKCMDVKYVEGVINNIIPQLL